MAIVIKKAAEYLIWESGCGWHVSRLNGREDEHTAAARLLVNRKNGVENAKRYFASHRLTVEVHPLDDELKNSPLLLDTFKYFKETEYVAS